MCQILLFPVWSGKCDFSFGRLSATAARPIGSHLLLQLTK